MSRLLQLCKCTSDEINDWTLRPPIQAGLAASYMGSFKNNRSKAQLASHAKRRGEGQGSAAEDEEGEEGEDSSQPTSYGARRASGKRQVRPNQTRADLGYVEPSEGKKRRRDTVDDDGAGPSGESGGVGIGGGGGGSSSSRIPFGLTVDFCKLDMAALKRYKRHYRLKVRPNVTKGELANAVARHFASQTVDEADTISLFMYTARAIGYEQGPPRAAWA